MNGIHDEEIPVHASSGNIFADLGRPDVEEAFAGVAFVHFQGVFC